MSIRLRLLAAFAFVLVLVVVALEVPLALTVRERIESDVESHAAGQAHLIAASSAGALENERALSRIVESAAEDLGGRVIVVDDRGRLLADSAGGGLADAPYGNRPEISAALAGETSQGERYSSTLDEDLLYTAVPVLVEGEPGGAVRITQSLDEMHDRIRRDVLGLVAIGGLTILLGLAFASVLAGSLSRPLRALARAARRVGGGELDTRAEVTGPKEQREVAHAFNDMATRLEQAFAAQREFVANASHQLRTPLTGLRLRLEAAALKAEDADLAEELEAAERELDRLARLLAGLLTLAREERRAPELGSIDLSACAEAAAERWRPQAEVRGQRLVAEGPEGVNAAGSPEDVAIVLDNLLENALAYSPPGTEIGIQWGSDGDFARLAVLDEGPGLEPGEEERVFDRFARGSTGRTRPHGTGLGLAIVAALARRWGGRATIANRPNGGAIAEVRLPATSGNGAVQPGTPSEAVTQT
jgi:two-component system, OmpR family, sensor kinase